MSDVLCLPKHYFLRYKVLFKSDNKVSNLILNKTNVKTIRLKNCFFGCIYIQENML